MHYNGHNKYINMKMEQIRFYLNRCLLSHFNTVQSQTRTCSYRRGKNRRSFERNRPLLSFMDCYKTKEPSRCLKPNQANELGGTLLLTTLLGNLSQKNVYAQRIICIRTHVTNAYASRMCMRSYACVYIFRLWYI